MFTTLASVKPRLRLTPLSSTLPTTASHSAPALVLTRSPRDLTPPLRDLLLTTAMAMLDTLATHTPPSMVLSLMPLPPPLLDSSTLPMSGSAPTTSELLFLARQLECLKKHQSSTVITMLPQIGRNKD